jgi:CysZ protein
MLRALSRAISQLFDPAIFGVLVISAAGAALVLAAIWFGIGELLGHVVLFTNRWLNWLAGFAVGVGTVFVTIALFGAIAAVIASLFVERVARAVERRYYPGLPAPRSPGVAEQVGAVLSFLFATVAVNLLALPLYLIWGANIPIFLGINGYLLGRAYFELVAMRRLDRRAVTILWRTHRAKLILCGALIAALSFVPLANLLTPVLATAFMLHILQGFREFQETCDRTRFGDTPVSLNHRS